MTQTPRTPGAQNGDAQRKEAHGGAARRLRHPWPRRQEAEEHVRDGELRERGDGERVAAAQAGAEHREHVVAVRQRACEYE